MNSRRPRILYFIVQYPNFSETYMHEEIRSLLKDYDIRIVTYKESPFPRREPFPYELIEYSGPCFVYDRFEDIDRTFSAPQQKTFIDRVSEVIDEFQPDVLHCHYFGLALLLEHLAEKHSIPFTIRTHSMDVLYEPSQKLEALCGAVNGFWCLGIIAFPAFQSTLLELGTRPERLVSCWPVINFSRFHKPDERARTNKVMCAGPCIKKKAHKKFIDLAVLMQGQGITFDLYADGYELASVKKYNESQGNPVNIMYVDPDDMPGVYPQYDWIVYTSDTTINKVGFPTAIVEAQASGIGVCWQELPGRKNQQQEFLTEAGVLFKTIDEIPAIISKTISDETRKLGVEAASRSDIEGHKHLLTQMWNKSKARIEMSEDETDLVSIIIPYYEKIETLEIAINSALAQTYKNIEVIVVDDGSSTSAIDGLSPEILAQIQLIRHEKNRGVSAARNTAIRNAKGKYIVPLDSDDQLLPTFVCEMVRTMKEGEYDCTYSYMQWILESDYLMKPKVTLINLLARKEGFATFLYKREVFNAIGGYRETMAAGSDHQFMLEASAREFSFGSVDKPLWLYRKNSEGLAQVGLNERMRDLMEINADLYQKYWPEIIAKLDEYYIELIYAHQHLLTQEKVLREEQIAKNQIHNNLPKEYSQIFNEYKKVLAAYEINADRIMLSQSFIETMRQEFGETKKIISNYAYSPPASLAKQLREIAIRGIEKIEKLFSTIFPQDDQLSVDCQTVSNSELFDERFYKQQCLAQGLQVGNPLKHFLSDGWKLGLDPNPFFNVEFYGELQRRKNVEGENPLLHYLREGAQLGWPTSHFFDTHFYLKNYPDVCESKINPLRHYIRFGAQEGRICSQIEDLDCLYSQQARNSLKFLPINFSQSNFSTGGISSVSTENGDKNYDLILGIHEASRTGAPMLGCALASGFKRRGLNTLIILQDDGELLNEFSEIADLLNLSKVIDKPQYLDETLKTLLQSSRVHGKDPVVVLNSAELNNLHEVFKSNGFNVITLVHEFMSCYSPHIREKVRSNTDLAIFSSNIARQDALAHGANWGNTQTIPQGLLNCNFGKIDKTGARQAICDETGILPTDFIVLGCGTLETRKGIDIFLQIANQTKAVNSNIKFIWIGGEHKYGRETLDWIERDIEAAGLTDTLFLLGHKEKLDNYFAGANLFLLPSRLDPLPCVLHMAMTCSMPVVAFAGSGGAEEVLAHGGGKLVPYLNSASMTEAVLHYADNKEAALRDGQTGKLVVETHYNFENYVDKILDLTNLQKTKETSKLVSSPS